jgi:hypothetical protein
LMGGELSHSAHLSDQSVCPPEVFLQPLSRLQCPRSVIHFIRPYFLLPSLKLIKTAAGAFEF